MIRGLLLSFGFISFGPAQAVEIQYRGEQYTPAFTTVRPQSPSMQAAAIQLQAQQQMRSVQTQQLGELTGQLLVRSTQMDNIAELEPLNAIYVGTEYALLSFAPNTNLYSKLQQALRLEGMINAELEVSTQRLSPR